MLAELRVKVKSLAAEARIIRREERRARCGRTRESLYLHRIRDVRGEARAALLAYAFLRGREYGAAETPGKFNRPDWKRVLALVNKFGTGHGGPSWKGTPEVLAAWAAGTLAEHPFRRVPRPVTGGEVAAA